MRNCGPDERSRARMQRGARNGCSGDYSPYRVPRVPRAVAASFGDPMHFCRPPRGGGGRKNWGRKLSLAARPVQTGWGVGDAQPGILRLRGVPYAFEDSMTRGILRFVSSIAIRCVFHRCENQDIHRYEFCCCGCVFTQYGGCVSVCVFLRVFTSAHCGGDRDCVCARWA
jgi:hypothetical protein